MWNKKEIEFHKFSSCFLYAKEMEETKMEQRKWINYGDVNFLEHGGCLVAPSYSEDEIKENPELSDVFNVFKVITDAGDDENAPIFAALYTIDISDYEDKKEMILEAAGFESKEKLEKSSKMPASECSTLKKKESCGPNTLRK